MIEIRGRKIEAPEVFYPAEEGALFPRPVLGGNGQIGIRCSWECDAFVPVLPLNGKAAITVPAGWWIVRTAFSTLFHCPEHPYNMNLNQTDEEAEAMQSSEDQLWASMIPWLKACPFKLVPFSIGEGGLLIEFGPLGREAMLRAIDVNDDDRLPVSALTELREAIEASTGPHLVSDTSQFDLILSLGLAEPDEREPDGSIDLTALMAGRLGTEGHAKAFMTIWARLLMTKKVLAEAAKSPAHFAQRRDAFSTYRRGTDRVKRNDPCPCGSKKKFKKCCS